MRLSFYETQAFSTYDEDGNVSQTEKERWIGDDRTTKTEHACDEQGILVMVKSCLKGDKAQSVQYFYDI